MHELPERDGRCNCFKKGDYVIALKRNQYLFYKDVQDYFEESTLRELEKKEGGYKKTVEQKHGGVTIREYYITEDTIWFSERTK